MGVVGDDALKGNERGAGDFCRHSLSGLKWIVGVVPFVQDQRRYGNVRKVRIRIDQGDRKRPCHILAAA